MCVRLFFFVCIKPQSRVVLPRLAEMAGKIPEGAGNFRDTCYFCGSNLRFRTASTEAYEANHSLANVLSASSTVVSSIYLPTSITSSHVTRQSFLPTGRLVIPVSSHICRACTKVSRPMFLAGKCSSQLLVAASDLVHIPSRLFLMGDCKRGRHPCRHRSTDQRNSIHQS